MFDGTYLKIERAKKHVSELDATISAYLERNPFELVIKKESTKHSWLIKTKEPVPLVFSAILGDAVHNLRAALDLTIFEMVGHKAPSPDSVYFPFCKGAAAYQSTIAGRQIQIAGKRVVDAIETLQPYPGGDELLYGLHTLDIADKHKLILTVGMASDLNGFQIQLIDRDMPYRGGDTVRMTTDTPFVKQLNFVNREIARKAQSRTSVINHKPDIQPSFDICFGKGQPFASESVRSKLDLMVVRVIDVCDLLIKSYR